MSKNTNEISPLKLQFEIRRNKLTQRDVAKILKVTDGAISSAIKGDPLLTSLRLRIIQLIEDKKRGN